jgi:hypothetical protein
MSGQLHTPAALLPGKEPWYPLNRTLGENHNWSLFPYWDLSHLGNWYSEEVLKIHFHHQLFH